MLSKKQSIFATFLAVIILSIVPFSFAVDPESDYVPDWYQTWDGEQQSILGNFWDNLHPFASPGEEKDPYDDADMYGWYKGTFFSVRNWEREVCLMDLSKDVQSVQSTTISTDTVNIYTTTLTAVAKKTILYNTTLYEVSWFIRPVDDTVSYKVYLSNANSKEYFVGGATAFQSVGKQGANGYIPKYISIDYTEVVMEYTAGNLNKTFKSMVVVK